MVNVHWGGGTEDNSFGTHEFMRLCELVGCEPYINGNLGSGTVQEMSEWVEYLTFDGQSPMTELRAANGRKEPWKVRYFGVGNENWGCGGNMTADEYSAAYRRYQTYLRGTKESPLYKIACGPNEGDLEWTERLMKTSGRHMDGLTLHYYTITGPSWQDKGSALEFSDDDYYTTVGRAQHMETLVRRHSAIMDRYDPDRRVGLLVDEWGTWFNVEPGTNPGFLYQQNTIRDALVAAGTLTIFSKASDRVRMANLAQTVNVLQSPILTKDDKIVLTPTFHAFEMMASHQGATLVDSQIESRPLPGAPHRIDTGEGVERDLRETASVSEDGALTLTIANMHASESREIDATILGHAASSVTGRLLAGDPHDHNTFAEPERVAPREFTEVVVRDGGLRFTLPPASVVTLSVGA
jgi:alpha-N-arabinofuranosidase